MTLNLPPHLAGRTRRLNRRHLKRDRDYVLCWLQQALRSHDNPIIDAAVSLGNELNLPVVVYHGLDNRYPHASLRLHRFALEASQSLTAGLQQRRLRFCRYVRRPEKRIAALVYKLADDAAAIVTDDMPTFVARRQAASVARKTDVPVLAVDANCLVPMSSFDKPLQATKSFRAAHRPRRQEWIDAEHDVAPEVRKYTRRLCFEPDDIEDLTPVQLDDLIGRCGVDMTLPVAPDFRGHRDAALSRMHHAIENVVPRYKWTRNNPSLEDSTTGLSPSMHFGVLGPREVTAAVQAADLHSAARWKFLDELLTWREYYQHLAYHSDDPADYRQVPAWARKSLAEHADDPRESVYTLSQLLHAETDDATWNAAQRQFLLDGWMHNNLRMYWVKQILRWTPTPEAAWHAATYLNDRLSLDGRDGSTYGGIQWGFGRSRRGYREIPIYGWVPPKTDTAILKRKGMPEWIEWMNARDMIRVDGVADP